MELFSDRLKHAMKIANVKAIDLARLIDVDRSTISNYLNNKYEPKADKTYLIAKALNVSVSWLMGFNDEITKDYSIEENSKIPIYSYISCGDGLFNDNEIIDYLPLPKTKISNPDDYFSVIAKGDSMKNKGINTDDIIVFQKVSILDDGDIGCFCINHEHALCKIFRIDKKSKNIILQSANEEYAPIVINPLEDSFRIIGKLAFILQDRRKL